MSALYKPIAMRISWRDDIFEAMDIALGSERDRQFLKEQVIEGVAKLWYIPGSESYAITRVEADCLCICAYQGSKIMQFGNILLEQARCEGLNFVKAHVRDPRLVRYLLKNVPCAQRLFETHDGYQVLVAPVRR